MKIFIKTFVVLQSFTIIYGNDLIGNRFEITEEDIQSFDLFVEECDIYKIWGSINNNSVKILPGGGFSMNLRSETIAAWNVTYKTSRIIDGLRLRSFNGTGAVGDLLDGGVGFNFAVFMLVGHSNHFYFLIDAYENYTSSLLPSPTTTPGPDITFKEWGVINYASKELDGQIGYTQYASPGELAEVNGRIDSSKPIDGIRLTSCNRTVSSAKILDGGIGFNFFSFKVVGNEELVDFYFNTFENGTYHEIREQVFGTVSNNTKLDEKRIQNYPQLGAVAEGNATFSTSGLILGIRLTYLNYTDGKYEITKGGIGESLVAFDFKGPYLGEPFDFTVEIFGNNANGAKISIIMIFMLFLIFFLLM